MELEIADIKARLAQCEDDSPEQEFWLDQLWEIKEKANDVEQGMLDEMNRGSERHG